MRVSIWNISLAGVLLIYQDFQILVHLLSHALLVHCELPSMRGNYSKDIQKARQQNRQSMIQIVLIIFMRFQSLNGLIVLLKIDQASQDSIIRRVDLFLRWISQVLVKTSRMVCCSLLINSCSKKLHQTCDRKSMMPLRQKYPI